MTVPSSGIDSACGIRNQGASNAAHEQQRRGNHEEAEAPEDRGVGPLDDRLALEDPRLEDYLLDEGHCPQRQVVQPVFSEVSEGQRALIALYMLVYCALTPDRTLLIDEPDNFIALAEIQPH